MGSTVIQTTVALALRDHEEFHSIVRPFTGVCTKSGKPLMEVRLAWDETVVPTDSHDGRRRERSGWTHQVTRHSDGTACSGGYGDPPEMKWHCHSQGKCPKCNTYGSLVTAQEAWGNRTTCTARNEGSDFKPCDYESYYSIGD